MKIMHCKIGLTLLATSFTSLVYATNQPNVVFILTDDQGYGDLGITGNPYVKTPNIDKLAKEAITLDRFMVSAVSAPTRASLMTGRYHIATGVNWVTGREEVMNTGEVTIAELLRAEGYNTGCFGKWHNGAQYPHNPVGQGFDEFLGFCNGHINNYFNPTLENTQGEQIKIEGYIADIFTDRAIDFIDQHKDEPFFCYIPYNTPHGPFQVPDKYYNHYKNIDGISATEAAVYGMCENIDDNVGRVIKHLKKEGLYDNTIIIYTTDNGPNSYRWNDGMKGKKATLHEGGVRVPFFMRIPNTTPKVVEQLTAHIDLLPTLAHYCQLNIPDTLDIHGCNLSPLIENTTAKWPERYIFSHNQPWRTFEERVAGTIRSEEYRLVYTRDKDSLLYNMQTDPGQTTDIYHESPLVVEQLGNAYHDWFVQMTNNGVHLSNEPAELGHPEAKNIIFAATEAKLYYKVKYSGAGWSHDWAKNINNPKAAMVWDIKVVKDATYDVSAMYRCSDSGVGITLVTSTNNPKVNRCKTTITEPNTSKMVPSQDRVKRSETYEYPWSEAQIGKLKLKKGTYRLKLTFENIVPNNDLQIYALTLKAND